MTNVQLDEFSPSALTHLTSQINRGDIANTLESPSSSLLVTTCPTHNCYRDLEQHRLLWAVAVYSIWVNSCSVYSFVLCFFWPILCLWKSPILCVNCRLLVLTAVEYSTAWLCHSLLIYSTIDGYLGFQFAAITSSASGNILACGSCWTWVHITVDFIFGSGFLGPRGYLCSSLWETVFLSGWTSV